jgi:hypothetical protein
MEEKRRATRFTLRTSLNVISLEMGEKVGSLLNLSPHGMLIKAKAPIVVGKKMELSLHLPKKIFGKEHLDVEAQCVWVKPDTDPQYHQCGFEFIDVSSQDANVILGLIMDQNMLE